MSSIYVKAQGTLAPLSSAKITDADLKIITNANIGVVSHTNNSANLTAHISLSTDAERVLLTMDEAVLGFIDLTNNRGELAIEDVKIDSEFTLIPYSTTGRRGSSYTITADGNTAETPHPDTEPATPTTPLPSTPTSRPDIPTNTTSPQPIPIPKAPNTGVRRLDQEEANMSNP